MNLDKAAICISREFLLFSLEVYSQKDSVPVCSEKAYQV